MLKTLRDVIEFGKQLGKLLIVTRGENGSIAIKNQEIVECQSKPNLEDCRLNRCWGPLCSWFSPWVN